VIICHQQGHAPGAAGADLVASEDIMRIGILTLVATILVLSTIGPSSAQIPSAGAGPGDKFIRLRRPDGRPCLGITSQARVDAILKDNYHHYVSVENDCPRVISVKICYKGDAYSCQDIQVKPYDTMVVMLGTMAGQPSFDYEFNEHWLNGR